MTDAHDPLAWIGAGIDAQAAADAAIQHAQADILKVGVRVRKPQGYEFDSIIVAQFYKLNGELRLVCESTVIEGLLHIFAPSQVVPDRRRRK